jgi:hypothetical protein
LDILRQIWNVFFGGGRAAFWTALFTGILTIVTWQIYDVYRVIDNTSRSSSRAFLIFAGPQNGAKMIDNSGTWTGQEIASVWQNAGDTPARDAVIKTSVDSFYPDLPETYSFPLTTKSKIVL